MIAIDELELEDELLDKIWEMPSGSPSCLDPRIPMYLLACTAPSLEACLPEDGSRDTNSKTPELFDGMLEVLGDEVDTSFPDPCSDGRCPRNR